MARLPSAESLGILPTPQSNRPITGYDGGAIARAASGLGQSMWDASQQIAQRDDTQAVFEARRKLDDWERSAVYDPNTGVVSKLGRDALSLPQTVPTEFDKFAGEVSQTLTSPRQQQAFQEMAQARRNQIADFTIRHATQQKNVFEVGQYKADIDASTERAALLATAGNLAGSAGEVDTMKDRTINFMHSRGVSEEQIAQELKANASKVHSFVINQFLESDKPTVAADYLKSHASDMGFEDMLRAKINIDKQTDVRAATVVATDAVQALRPGLTPTDGDRLTNLVMGAESRGRRFDANGALLQGPVTASGERAQGEMQVMPSTAAKPGYGIKPADMTGTPNQQADELARVGREKLAVLVKRYAGDIPKALAAYNWGEANVDQAVIRAKELPDGDWLTFAPPETQKYVLGISKAYADGNGSPSTPTLEQVHADIRAKMGDSRPQALQTALTVGTQQWEDALKAKKAAEDDATANAMKWVESTGGRYSEMPAGLRNAIPVRDVDNVMNFAAKVYKGDDVSDPIVFQKMATDDAYLKNLSVAAFYAQSRKLSQSDAQEMAKRRGTLLNKAIPPGQQPTDLDYAAVNKVLDNQLAQMNLAPTPKDGSSDAQRVGAMRRATWDYVLQGQLQSGKKFDDAGVTNRVHELFAKNVSFQNTFFGFNTGTAAHQIMGMTVDDIPGDVKDRIKTDFKKAGIPSPTDGQILGAFLRFNVASGGATGGW